MSGNDRCRRNPTIQNIPRVLVAPCYLTPRKSPRGKAGGLVPGSKMNRDYFTRLRLPSVRRRSALSLMKPAASFWS